MNWIQEKNKITDMGDSVKFELYAEGEGLKLSIDDMNWIEPSEVNNKEHKFEITVKKESKVGQDFWIKEWGYLSILHYLNKDKLPEEQGNKTIQLLVFQNCSNNNGVHFRAEVIFPDNNTNSYNFNVINKGTAENAEIEKTGHNSWVIKNHNNGKSGFFQLIVTRKDCKPCKYESHSTTCNHHGDPTNCPENERVISLVNGNKLLKQNEVFSIEVKGNITCDSVTYNINIVEIDKTTFQITGFPFKLHYQPSCGDACHGWTELYQETE